jgi:hypothetical protein
MTPTPQNKLVAVKPASFWEREGLDDPPFTGEIGTQTPSATRGARQSGGP